MDTETDGLDIEVPDTKSTESETGKATESVRITHDLDGTDSKSIGEEKGEEGMENRKECGTRKEDARKKTN